jgi:transposase
MCIPACLPHFQGLRIAQVSVTGNQISLDVVAARPAARCPVCHQTAVRVHRRYRRTVADLPWSGHRVTLHILARRFWCTVGACPRRIFGERRTDLAEAYARRTLQLATTLTTIGLALGGRPGAGLADKLRVPTSRLTLLRIVRRWPDPLPLPPRVLGVAAWAFRRGRRFGTIRVDLEQHHPVDLLPDATASRFAAWLRDHPGVEVISRDRGGAFAEGAHQAAPQAIQVADRFHLLRNFGKAGERVLHRHADLVRQVPAPHASPVSTEDLRRDRHVSRERVRPEMAERFDAISKLKAQGWSSSATARTLGLQRPTGEKSGPLPTSPQRHYPQNRARALAPDDPYLQAHWRQGKRKARARGRDIVGPGYPGASENVARYVAARRRQEAAGASPPPAAGLTSQHAIALTLLRPERRTRTEEQTVAQLKTVHPTLTTALQLLERFAHLLRQRTALRLPEDLDHWMTDTVATEHRELVAFVRKLTQDRDAVRAAFELPYSQGQTEGQITRLKALKRAMDGRANFDLLRKRFLADR